MTVRSREVDDTESGAALFSRKDLARSQTTSERFVAFALLAISFGGSILFGGGGAESWLARAPNWIGLAAALIAQSLFTRWQWIYALKRWRSLWWLGAFAGSTAMTVAGFWPLTHPYLWAGLQAAQVPAQSAWWLAAVILVVLAGVLDFLPEQILTR